MVSQNDESVDIGLSPVDYGFKFAWGISGFDKLDPSYG
jgi:hypothetical protein